MAAGEAASGAGVVIERGVMSRTSKRTPSRSLYGISFDGVAVSGITMEFAKLARYSHMEGYGIFLDLGYDIKTDKENFLQPYPDETSALPAWIHLDRLVNVKKIDGYGQEFLGRIARGEPGGHAPGEGDLAQDASRMVADIANQMVARWRRLAVPNGVPTSLARPCPTADSARPGTARFRRGSFPAHKACDMSFVTSLKN
jgi:hypothetical protein